MESGQSPTKMNDQILYLGFNQDNSCFFVGTEEGFLIFNVNPFKLIFKRSN